MAIQYARTPVNRKRDFDGNGKLSPAEIANGVKLVKNPNGTGWTRIDPRKPGRLAHIQDASATKNLAELDQLKKENEDLRKFKTDSLALMKDMDKRLREIESKKEIK